MDAKSTNPVKVEKNHTHINCAKPSADGFQIGEHNYATSL